MGGICLCSRALLLLVALALVTWRILALPAHLLLNPHLPKVRARATLCLLEASTSKLAFRVFPDGVEILVVGAQYVLRTRPHNLSFVPFPSNLSTAHYIYALCAGNGCDHPLPSNPDRPTRFHS